MPERILRLYPPPSEELPHEAVYEDLVLSPKETSGRPHVAINAVASVNGGAALKGGGSSIGSRTDRLTMRALRSRFDAVMVGANTLRKEKVYLLDSEGRRPLLVVPTTTGRLPLEDNPGDCDARNTLVFTPESLPDEEGRRLSRLARVVRVRPEPGGDLSIQGILATLRNEFWLQKLLVEGGPTLNASLISRGLVDELYLTLAPKLLAGSGPLLPPEVTQDNIADAGDLKLISLNLAANELYLRYAFLR